MRRWLVIGAGAAGAAAIGLPAGYLTAQYVDQPSVVGFAPGDGTVTNEASPAIKLDIDNADNVDELRVAVDGKDVTANLRALPDGFALEGVALEDGEHRVELQGKGTGLFGQRLTGDWRILVDTTEPELVVTSPAQKKWQKKPMVRGRSEPGIRIEITYPGGKAQGEAGADGKFAIPLPVDPGRHQLHITAIDDAGNRLERQRMLRYDDAAPEVVVRGAKGWSTESSPLIMGTLRDTSKTTLDGHPRRQARGAGADVGGLRAADEAAALRGAAHAPGHGARHARPGDEDQEDVGRRHDRAAAAVRRARASAPAARTSSR